MNNAYEVLKEVLQNCNRSIKWWDEHGNSLLCQEELYDAGQAHGRSLAYQDVLENIINLYPELKDFVDESFRSS